MLSSTWEAARIVENCQRYAVQYEETEIQGCELLSRYIAFHNVQSNGICRESQLTNVFEERSILSANQFGFRRKLGTTDALILLQHKRVPQIDKGGVFRVLVVDISGAFDRVLRAGLLHKLQKIDFTERMS